jgi:hypothetical protein
MSPLSSDRKALSSTPVEEDAGLEVKLTDPTGSLALGWIVREIARPVKFTQ